MDQVAAAVLVLGALAVLMADRFPPVIVLTVPLIVAGVTGMVPTAELLSGLSNTGVVTVAAMFIVARGVSGTGVVSRAVTRLLGRVTGSRGALARLLPPIAVASSVMNNTPIVAMCIPMALELEERRGISARRLLLPIAYASTLGGAVTLIGTSSNLLISGLAQSGGVSLGMFAFAPAALAAAAAGLLFLVLLAPRLVRPGPEPEPETLDWRVELRAPAGAGVVGHDVTESALARSGAYRLVAARRGDLWTDLGRPAGGELDSGAGRWVVRPDDLLAWMATRAGVAALWNDVSLGGHRDRLYMAALADNEAESLAKLTADAGLHVVATPTDGPLEAAAVHAGALVLVAAPGREQVEDRAVISVARRAAGSGPRPSGTYVALAILAGVVVCASINLIPLVWAALIGALLMVATRVLPVSEAAAALDWATLGVLAASIGLGEIVTSTGLADTVAKAVSGLSKGVVPLSLAILFAVGVVTTNVVTNAAAATVLFPVAVQMAAGAHAPVTPFLATLAVAVSAAFVNPAAYQTNLMVQRPGGYPPRTYAKLGLPLTVVVGLVTVAAAYAWVRLAQG